MTETHFTIRDLVGNIVQSDETVDVYYSRFMGGSRVFEIRSSRKMRLLQVAGFPILA